MDGWLDIWMSKCWCPMSWFKYLRHWWPPGICTHRLLVKFNGIVWKTESIHWAAVWSVGRALLRKRNQTGLNWLKVTQIASLYTCGDQKSISVHTACQTLKQMGCNSRREQESWPTEGRGSQKLTSKHRKKTKWCFSSSGLLNFCPL